MKVNRLSVVVKAILATFTVAVLVTSVWAAPQEQLLYSFAGTNGLNPQSSLIFDSSGNLYGTTLTGGEFNVCPVSGGGCGTVFGLSPKTGGGWTETVLHNFQRDGKDGNNPYGGLIFDGTGNLYGTTVYGGICGCGTVFELMPATGGVWTEKVLHSFNMKDGSVPYSTLTFDTAGNLYGTTFGGGNSSSVCIDGCGLVFELSPQAGGGWSEKAVHKFTGGDGGNSLAGLIFDHAGNLRHNLSGRGSYGLQRQRLRHGVRVVTPIRRRMDGEGVAQVPRQ